MDVNSFKGSFRDFSRSNRFRVQIQRLDGNKMEFHCKAAALPGSTIEAINVPYMGRQIKIPGDRTYEDWNVTVFLDVSHQLRKELYQWKEQMNATVGNIGSPPAAVKSDATIEAIGIDGATLNQYHFVGMFPTTVGAVEYDRDSNNTIATMQCTFAYDYYEQS